MDDDEIEAWWAQRIQEVRRAEHKHGELVICARCGHEQYRGKKSCEQCGTCHTCPE